MPTSSVCFLQNRSRKAMRHVTLMAKTVVDVITHQPLTVCVSNFWDIPVHLLQHTAFHIALPPFAHIVTVGSASSGVAKFK